MSTLDIFKTYTIKFENEEEFEKVLEQDHMAIDIGYSDMVLVYSNEDERDEVALKLENMNYQIVCD